MPVCTKCNQKKPFWSFGPNGICSECAAKETVSITPKPVSLETVNKYSVGLTVYLKHLSGMENLNITDPNKYVKITIDAKERKLHFDNANDKTPIAVLDITKITDAREATQVVSENKSVTGRAAIGGLIFGPVGAIVGGLSALDEQTGIATRVVIFTYKSQEETKQIVMACIPSISSGYQNFIEYLPKDPNSPYAPPANGEPVEL
ncbi:MAG: hypothetical protein IJB67_01900 [Firmicutes bacterium]|nr:hypothetical protein [Bacillota bacterium]